MAKIQTLKDKDGETVYPLTKTEAVSTGEDSTLDVDIASLDTRIADIETELPNKLEMDDLVPLWSGFYYTQASGVANTSGTFTTKRGTTINYTTVNGGSGILVKSGANNVNIFKAYGGVRMSSSLTDDYGLHGLLGGSTRWVRVYASESNGSAGTMREGSATVVGSTEGYVSLLSSGGSKTSDQYTIQGIRIAPGSNIWKLFGKVGSAGTLTTVSFEAEVTASGVGYLPSFYQRGGNQSNIGATFHYLEVLEVS